MMRVLLIALLTTSLLVAGCEDDSGLDCPSEDDLVSSTFDLGTNPRVFPSPRFALAGFLDAEGFLGGEGQDLDASQFSGETKSKAAELSYTHDGRKLAHVYLKRLGGGWLVIGYDFCRGQL